MKTWLRQNRGFLLFLLGFAFFRSAVADWNTIPSGSMRPTLLEGDVVLVDRLAYDLKVPLVDVVVVQLAAPQRGDVVTFTSPRDGTRLIKRLVAVPGDIVEMRDERLLVNGVAAEYGSFEAIDERGAAGLRQLALRGTERSGGRTHEIQLLPEAPAMRSFGPIVVPADSYFFLGDNRDDSADSRYIGVVPRHRLIERARAVLVSADILQDWMPRLDRFATSVR